MQTTYKEQIEAIRDAMRSLEEIYGVNGSDYRNAKSWLALNDAASTIAALDIQSTLPKVFIPGSK